MRSVTVVDSTLRDGSHAKRHRFKLEEVRRIARGLNEAGVDVVEVSHGDGLGGSSFTYGFSETDEFELIANAYEQLTRARLAVLLLPGIGVKDDLRRARELGATVARIATHCTEADIAESHLSFAREIGMTAVGFLMMAHATQAEPLAEQAAIMANSGAQVVYVTDSAGSLLPEGVVERISALRHRLPLGVEVGFHGHENLSLAVANSLAAVGAGATWIDGCACGLGAGAGNSPTEALAAVLERAGIATGIDTFAMFDVAEEVVRPILNRSQLLDRDSLVLGYLGVYSSFLLHAATWAKRFGVSSTDVLVEVGNRKAVGGQEDIIPEIAASLAAKA